VITDVRKKIMESVHKVTHHPTTHHKDSHPPAVTENWLNKKGYGETVNCINCLHQHRKTLDLQKAAELCGKHTPSKYEPQAECLKRSLVKLFKKGL